MIRYHIWFCRRWTWFLDTHIVIECRMTWFIVVRSDCHHNNTNTCFLTMYRLSLLWKYWWVSESLGWPPILRWDVITVLSVAFYKDNFVFFLLVLRKLILVSWSISETFKSHAQINTSSEQKFVDHTKSWWSNLRHYAQIVDFTTHPLVKSYLLYQYSYF